jgi:hypothetical protein
MEGIELEVRDNQKTAYTKGRVATPLNSKGVEVRFTSTFLFLLQAKHYDFHPISG